MRRRGRPGDYLATDDNTGFTVYGSQLRAGYYGEYARNPLKRNLQEIASPLNDPAPVAIYRGPNYEVVSSVAALVSAPSTVGNTTVPTNRSAPAIQSGVVK